VPTKKPSPRRSPAKAKKPAPRRSTAPASAAVQITKASPRDLPQIARLAGLLVRQHHAFDAERFLFIEDPESGYKWWFGKELANKKALILCAKLGGKIVGYAYARQEPRDWNSLLDAFVALHDILVAESARCRGIGKLLLEGVVAEMKARGAARMVLHTAVQNQAAQRLFTAFGFRTTMLEMTCEL
jgi:ribosomal protein S18 acetylase RimI-like enzyme